MRVCCTCKAALEPSTPPTRKYCLPCWRERAREYRARHPEKTKAACDKWREANRDAARVTAARWAQANPERKREHQKRWYDAHGAEWREQHADALRTSSREHMRVVSKAPAHKAKKREWYARNSARVTARTRAKRAIDPEPFRAVDRARYERSRYQRVLLAERARARRAGAPGSHTVAEWKSVLRHFKRRCLYCGAKLTTANISKDHKVPLSRGGSNAAQNIVPACRRCNSRKNTKSVAEFSKHLEATSQ